MAITPNKALLFLAGGCVAAAAIAYVSGALDPLFKNPPATIAAAPAPGEAEPKDGRLPGAELPMAVSPEKPAQAAAPAADATAVLAPSFDVMRVEGDGSIVIAGKSAPNAKVELLVGSNVIGGASAGPDGDFAVVLEEPLKPGSYQIVLRSTAPDNVVAMSVATAVVSIPENKDGQVLALVEEPGKPSEMIVVPKPEAPPAGAQAAAETPAMVAPVAEPKPGEQVEAALPPAPAAAEAPAAPVASGPSVTVAAVEIDGRKIFVAGVADAGRTVRGYANDILLGDAKASPDGRFLIEAERNLPVGDYIIRVDALEPEGVKVAARAAVPFEREPGESVAAVAPPAPEAPAAVAQAPAAQEAPSAAAQIPATVIPAGQTPPAATETPPPAAETPPAAVAAAGEAAPAVAVAPEAPAAATPLATAESPPAETPAAMAAPEAPAAAVAPATAEASGTAEASVPAAEGEAPAAIAQAPASEAANAEGSGTAAPAAETPATVAETPATAAETPAAEVPTTAPASAPAKAPAVAESTAEQAPPAVAAGTVPADTPAATTEAPAKAEVSAPQAPAAAPAAETPAAVAEAPLADTPSEPAPSAVTAAAAPETPAPAAEAAAAPAVEAAAAPDAGSAIAAPPPDGVPEVISPKLQNVDSAVIIRRGDTLWRISHRVYGRGVRYSTIYLANQTQIEDPDRIWPGQVFKVPEKSNDGKADADMTRLGSRLTTVPK